MQIKLDSFLRAENLDGATQKNPKEAKIVKVRLVPKEELAFNSEKDRWELTIALDDTEYQWLVNNTSMKSLLKAFGSESDHWVGKTVKLYSVTQNVSGEMKEVVYGEA